MNSFIHLLFLALAYLTFGRETVKDGNFLRIGIIFVEPHEAVLLIGGIHNEKLPENCKKKQ